MNEYTQTAERKERLENIWLRLVFMVLYTLVHRLAGFILFVVSFIQFLFTLFQDKPNSMLLEFASSLTQFIYQSGRFLSFQTEAKPFPFSDWPEAREQDLTANDWTDSVPQPVPVPDPTEAEPVATATTAQEKTATDEAASETPQSDTEVVAENTAEPQEKSEKDTEKS